MDLEHDAKNNIHARIDRKRKLPVTTLLKCLLSSKSEKYLDECNKKNILPDLKQIQGMTSENILTTFYDSINYKKDKYGWSAKLDLNFLRSKVINYDLIDSSNGHILIKKGT